MSVGWGERGAGGRRAQFGAWRVRRGCALLAFFTQDAYARRDARGARKRPAGGRARAPHRRRRKPQPIPAARPARQRAAASARAALKATPAGGGRRRPTAFGAAVRVRPDPQRGPPGDSPAAGGVARTCSDQSPAAHTRRSAFALRSAPSQGEGVAAARAGRTSQAARRARSPRQTGAQPLPLLPRRQRDAPLRDPVARRNRIIAAEAGVAELRRRLVAPALLAAGPVEAVERDEADRVDAEVRASGPRSSARPAACPCRAYPRRRSTATSWAARRCAGGPPPRPRPAPSP